MTSIRIGIVGTGISGLVSAKTLIAQGHSVCVFEKSTDIGGVWSPGRQYPGLRTQTARDSYAFSDFPMPTAYPEFPTAAEIHRYLQSYAQHHHLLSHIQLQTAVTGITRRQNGLPGWRVSVRQSDGAARVEEFDFVIVCNGVFNQPSVPHLPGREAFAAAGGLVLHSSELRNIAPLRGKDVVVVGFGKSALDIAEAAAEVARSCAIVCNRTLWKVPRFLIGRINAKHFILSRFSEFWLPHYEMRGLRRFIHERLPRLVDLYWFLSERGLGGQLGLLSGKLKPPLRLRESVGTCFGLAPDDNFQAVRSGRLGLHVGRIAALSPNGLELATGETVAANALVLATGFSQRCDFLGDAERAALFDRDGVPRLYRLLVCPGIDDMAFNGYNGGGASQLTAEIGARWIGELLAGRLHLPSRQLMDADIDRDLQLRRRLIRTPRGLGYYTAPFMFTYLDQLQRDMDRPPADSKKSIWRRYFTALDPRDFATESAQE